MKIINFFLKIYGSFMSLELKTMIQACSLSGNFVDCNNLLFDSGPKLIGLLIWIYSWFQSIIGHIEEIRIITANRPESINRAIVMRWFSTKSIK